MNSTKSSKGFTLVEVLIAIAISAVVLITSYQMFNAVERTGRFTQERNDLQNLISNLFVLFLRDFESSATTYGEFEIEDNNGTISFYTKNCFYVPGVCKVRYFMYKKDGWNFLVREERKLNSIVDAGFEIPITQNVEDFDVQFMVGSDWVKATRGKHRPTLIKLILKLKAEKGTVTVPFVFKPRG